MGIAPVGNTDPVQRAMWEKPADAGSISERGKAAAGQSKAKTLLQMMVDRGLKEEVRGRDHWCIGGGELVVCQWVEAAADCRERIPRDFFPQRRGDEGPLREFFLGYHCAVETGFNC